jgi:hypothetical protein
MNSPGIRASSPLTRLRQSDRLSSVGFMHTLTHPFAFAFTYRFPSWRKRPGDARFTGAKFQS